MIIDRRKLVSRTAASLLLGSCRAQSAAGILPKPHIPPWRGFNLIELAWGDRHQRYQESDFRLMAEWGFNFARLPCSYWTWSGKDDWMNISEPALQPL